MSRFHVVPEPADGRPRTIVHALEVIRNEVGFSESDTVEISVGPALPIAKLARSFCLKLKSDKDDVTHGVLMPACIKVRAIREGSSTIETFDVQDLNQAAVDSNGLALLKNGVRIRGIEAKPIPLPTEFSIMAWQILIVFIEMIGGRRKIYRSPRKYVPKLARKPIPKWRSIDFSALYKRLARPSIKIPSLKEIQFAYSERYQNQKVPSLAKISDTLRNAGVRNVRKRVPQTA
jgi:hypothetical protein